MMEERAQREWLTMLGMDRGLSYGCQKDFYIEHDEVGGKPELWIGFP